MTATEIYQQLSTVSVHSADGPIALRIITEAQIQRILDEGREIGVREAINAVRGLSAAENTADRLMTRTIALNDAESAILAAIPR